MSTPSRDAVTAGIAFALAAVTLFSAATLMVMYIVEVPTNGPFYFGAANDTLAGIGSLLFAFLVLRFGREAADTSVRRLFHRAVIVASLASALSSFLLVAKVLEFEVSTALSIVAIIVQAVWLLWVCQRYLAHTDFSRGVCRFGMVIGAGLCIGLALVSAAVLLPWLSWPQLTVGGLGLVLGGAVWLAWPAWYFVLGLRMRTHRQTRPGVAPPVAVG
ncbi:hypothetical protein [Glaciibacter sp. 2TAF33]|uniref:hypothetical protein n=1 Tax=Glaciibacter sp. 2TAF33 TaxID=3233015 RepID=UPI003F8FD638